MKAVISFTVSAQLICVYVLTTYRSPHGDVLVIDLLHLRHIYTEILLYINETVAEASHLYSNKNYFYTTMPSPKVPIGTY